MVREKVRTQADGAPGLSEADICGFHCERLGPLIFAVPPRLRR